MNITSFPAGAHLAAQLKGPLAHAYLISGDSAENRGGLAMLMARSLVCVASGGRPCDACVACEKAQRESHPDIIIVAPIDGKREIPVAAVRDVVANAPTLPNEAEHKVYLINPAEAMNPSAQNAILKVLEEPPSFVTFLLLAENPLALLPTVRSRCVTLSLTPTGEVNAPHAPSSEVEELVTAFLAAFDMGGLELLQFCVGLEKAVKEDRTILVSFVETGYVRLVERLAHASNDRRRQMEAVSLFDSLKGDLKFNVSAGHISGKMLATL
ncbi:MAG: hypothetical protein FWE28_07435 [Oscillospiraceae bacterium]|nr:hypothetical protein [Oscillospiraceae bacterium]